MELIIDFEACHWFILGMYFGIFILILSVVIAEWDFNRKEHKINEHKSSRN